MEIRLSSVFRGPCVNMFEMMQRSLIQQRPKRQDSHPYVWVFKERLTGEPDLSSNNTGCIHLLVYPVWPSKRTSKQLQCLKPSSCFVYFPCSSESPEHRGGSAAGEVNLDRRRLLSLQAPVRSAIPHTSTAKWRRQFRTAGGGSGRRKTEERGDVKDRGMKQIYRGAKTGQLKWDVEKKARRKGEES